MTLVRLLLFVPCFAIGLAFLYYGNRALRRAEAFRQWPQVQAELQQCELAEELEPDGPEPFYRVVVRYAYSVAGVTYESSRVAFGYAASKDEEFHRKLYDSLSRNKTVPVRYDPNEPATAALSAESDGSWLVFGTVWTTIVSFLFVMALFST